MAWRYGDMKLHSPTQALHNLWKCSNGPITTYENDYCHSRSKSRFEWDHEMLLFFEQRSRSVTMQNVFFEIHTSKNPSKISIENFWKNPGVVLGKFVDILITVFKSMHFHNILTNRSPRTPLINLRTEKTIATKSWVE